MVQRMFDDKASITSAIAKRQIRAAIQPIYNTINSKHHAVEALARLDHTQPSHLIEIADIAGMGHLVGLQVLELTVATFQNAPSPLNVNFSPNQLLNPLVFRSIQHILTTYNYPPSLITIELTEAPLNGTHKKLSSTLKAFIELGTKLSLDDFGVKGQSLLRALELPINQLKIDRAFITNIDRIPMKQDIVSSVLQLASKYGVEVIAEGVENKAESDCVQGLGGYLQQGYYWGRPQMLDIIAINEDQKDCNARTSNAGGWWLNSLTS